MDVVQTFLFTNYCWAYQWWRSRSTDYASLFVVSLYI